MATKIIFLVCPEVHLMDLAGPEQAFLEARGFGADFEIEHFGLEKNCVSSAGLALGPLRSFEEANVRAGDFVIVPGSNVSFFLSDAFRKRTDALDWLVAAHRTGANLVSICAGAFVFGLAGLLDGLQCTTHFQRTRQLQALFPRARVQENILFTEQKGPFSSASIFTSAGIASGVDLALHLVERLKGPQFAHRVARELVVYVRRNGENKQESDLLAFRNHLHSGIHRAQDYLLEHLDGDTSIAFLAAQANMSERNFTRVFKKETGRSPVEYLNFLRRERIGELLKKPDLSRRQVAERCGLRSERHLARLLATR